VTTAIAPLIAGNWKMNGLRGSLEEIERLKALVAAGPDPKGEIVVCPPATLLAAVSLRLEGSGISSGGQDCHEAPSGAHTGDVSAVMLADAGARFVILGHSERRADHHETDNLVAAKARAALRAGLVPIICVGETLDEREGGHAEKVVNAQLARSIPDEALGAEFVIAYEPVWAIGSGIRATSEDIIDMHATIRRRLVERFGAQGAGVRILYGGSMKPANATEILALPEVNGGLIGGASLLSNDLYAIISAL
jgi:triosephosphate isomerase